MREIKFRAWDTCDKKMIAEVMPHPHGYASVASDENGNVMIVSPAFKRWEIEQFTGLLDKNGKEIYEGDICKIVVDDTTDDYSISTVKFHDGAFTVDADFGEYDTSAIGWAITDCENGGGYIQVLGNIHENPELMEVK